VDGEIERDTTGAFQKPINSLDGHHPDPEPISGGETVIGKSRA